MYIHTMNIRITIFLLLLFCVNIALAQKTDTVAVSGNEIISDFKLLEIKPSFPGGNSRMYEYLGKTMTYPKSLAKEGIGGKVYVSFTIEKNGQVADVKVIKSAHPLIDEEVVRAIKKMPRWVPGIQGGRPVRVKYTLPVTMSSNRNN
jgi:protein TonB